MIPSEFIDAEIDAPQVVEIPPKVKTLDITVRVSLTNTGENDYVLHARSEDDQHFWHVLDENQREILREAQPRGRRRTPQIDEVRSVLLASGRSLHETVSLTLDATRLKDGKTYTLRSNLWGQLSESTFVAIHKPTAPKPKASGAKKADSGKKAAGQKTATKSKAKKSSKRTTKKTPKKSTKKSDKQ